MQRDAVRRMPVRHLGDELLTKTTIATISRAGGGRENALSLGSARGSPLALKRGGSDRFANGHLAGVAAKASSTWCHVQFARQGPSHAADVVQRRWRLFGTNVKPGTGRLALVWLTTK